MVYYTDRFPYVEPLQCLWVEACLTMLYDLFDVILIQFASIFEYFISIIML